MSETQKLCGFEKQAFSAWAETDPDFDILSFRSVAQRANMPQAKVRRAVRGLARKGLAKYCRSSWTDDGEPYGAGYGLTQAGRAMLENMEKTP